MPGDCRILVVDDEPRAVEMLARALRRLGRVPGTSGVELLTRISRRSLRTGRILITAHAEMSDTIAAINEGRIHAYLAKPCSPDEIRTAARSVLDLMEFYGRRSTRLLGDDPGMEELRKRIG
jgi:response regulator RpfG family c-di-GMP phosphodiesterase